MKRKKYECDYVSLGFLILSSIITLGIINLMMYVQDEITPKEFFSPELNFALRKTK